MQARMQAIRSGAVRVAVAALTGLCALPAAAQGSFDILVGQGGGALTVDFYSHGGAPPGGASLVDLATGQKLFTADFGDFPGGPRSTDDPGFQAFAGTLPPGALVYARGLGSLSFWAPSSGGWTAPPGGESIRLFGGVPTDVAIAYLFCQSGDEFLCDPGLAAQYPFYEQGTAFGAGSVTGPNPTIIDEATSGGGFHAHLDWFLEAPGTPSTGAFLLGLQLTMNGGALGDSAPFLILFNHGLPAAQFQQAVFSRTQPPALPPAPAIPEPSLGVLLAAGLAALAFARRVRS